MTYFHILLWKIQNILADIYHIYPLLYLGDIHMFHTVHHKFDWLSQLDYICSPHSHYQIINSMLLSDLEKYLKKQQLALLNIPKKCNIKNSILHIKQNIYQFLVKICLKNNQRWEQQNRSPLHLTSILIATTSLLSTLCFNNKYFIHFALFL